MFASDFDFELPEALIAQEPPAVRDAGRLLHLGRTSGALEHLKFSQLPSLMKRGDVMVFNNSRVIPARLLGHKAGTGGKAELLLVRPMADAATAEVLAARAEGSSWLCIGQASKAMKAGTRVEFEGGLTAEIEAAMPGGEYRVRFTSSLETLEGAIARAGRLPLPPYISRVPTAADAERYQTVFAKTSGSVAAPTAGLHFTEAVFAALDAAGVIRTFITLDVGPGTFLPVREDDLSKHTMHAERFSVPEATAHQVNTARREQRRVIAVGTTVMRTLESYHNNSQLNSGQGSTAIFITPGFEFKMVDALFTNFHLPKSTLVMLVSAFAGKANTFNAYAAAIAERYRFFSYGDAMFIDGAL